MPHQIPLGRAVSNASGTLTQILWQFLLRLDLLLGLSKRHFVKKAHCIKTLGKSKQGGIC